MSTNSRLKSILRFFYKKTLLFVLLSLFVHFLTTLSLFKLSLPERKTNTLETTEIEIINAPPQQIVREALVPDKLKAEQSPDPLSFLSKETQRVRKQTRAAATGMTANRTQQKSSQPEKPKQQTADDGVEVVTSKNPIEEMMKSEKGYSTFGEVLPKKLEVGSFTALNTDRYTFYSFYARTEELIRYHWERDVRRAIENGARPLNSTSQTYWRTMLEVLLKPNGEFHSVKLLKPAGIIKFDEAAAEAFRQARMFPNPPKEMIKEDGMIHIRYMFQVEYEPKVLVENIGP